MTTLQQQHISDPDERAIATIRTLCMDAVQAANSGHPGAPMAMAPVVYSLWQEALRFDPEDPIWPNRDRFVLSAGHASTLLYSMLHLTGVKAVDDAYQVLDRPAVSLDDLRRFRQLDSTCAGHPEYRHTSGVECTTGPLGTGAAASVGMSIAGRWMAAHFNRPGFELFDHDVYTLCGDGDLMEGISAEAASLAGHLRLSNLCWIYDSNQISIEGATGLAFTEDVATRFEGHGWHVLRVDDANDQDQLVRAFEAFRREQDGPTLIIVDSIIGYGAPNRAGTAKAHGEPLGEDEVRAAKRAYGWPEEERFLVPSEVTARLAAGTVARGRAARDAWVELFARYRAQHPVLADELDRIQRRELPDSWDAGLAEFEADDAGMATRDSSGRVLNAIAEQVPWLLSGSADLAPSTKTRLTFDGAGDLDPAVPGGRNIHFGVREHLAAAVVNGLSVSKLRAVWSTFLIFSDFARGAIRLSALMELPAIHVFTHDSIGVGEDGPTHQPVEQLASLRAMPGLLVFRPCDANEVVEMWRAVLPLQHEPVALALTRQKLPTLDRTRYASAAGLARGGYVLADPPDGRPPEAILIATGSEVHLALEAADELQAEGIAIRVVSLPCWELFERQPQAYRDEVLPPSVLARVAVEQAATLGWERYVGSSGAVLGMRSFGASAPLPALQARFGFTSTALAGLARQQLEQMRTPHANQGNGATTASPVIAGSTPKGQHDGR